MKEYLQKIREKAKEALRNILEKLGFGKYENNALQKASKLLVQMLRKCRTRLDKRKSLHNE